MAFEDGAEFWIIGMGTGSPEKTEDVKMVFAKRGAARAILGRIS